MPALSSATTAFGIEAAGHHIVVYDDFLGAVLLARGVMSAGLAVINSRVIQYFGVL